MILQYLLTQKLRRSVSIVSSLLTPLSVISTYTLSQELADSRGNILENTDLLDSLNKTKHSSITVAETLAEFERLQMELENASGKLPLIFAKSVRLQ